MASTLDPGEGDTAGVQEQEAGRSLDPELLQEQKCSGLLAPDFSGERKINSHLVSATVKRQSLLPSNLFLMTNFCAF